MKSAWAICRQKDQLSTLSQKLWHHLVPLKWSFLTWRTINFGIPLDDCLINKGFHMVSKCICCEPAYCETINHCFISSSSAQKVWAHFEDMLRINGSGNVLHQKLSSWWISKVNSPCHKAILSLIPTRIC